MLKIAEYWDELEWKEDKSSSVYDFGTFCSYAESQGYTYITDNTDTLDDLFFKDGRYCIMRNNIKTISVGIFPKGVEFSLSEF